MKFIHTADIHWGMNPDSDKPWSRERAQAIKDTFVRIIGEAKERDADCLFISGDLFHSQPLVRDLKEINYLFSTIPAITSGISRRCFPQDFASVPTRCLISILSICSDRDSSPARALCFKWFSQSCVASFAASHIVSLFAICTSASLAPINTIS